MKKYAEGLGGVIGAFVGGIIAGVAVYYTGSLWCCLCAPVGYVLGTKIGKAIAESAKTPDV